MELNQVKRISAAVLSVGVSKVKIVDTEKAQKAMTKDDVRKLLSEGAIAERPFRGQSRVRARKIAEQRRKGRRRGPGRRRGTKKARIAKKQLWIRKIRALRRELRKQHPSLNKGAYRKLYNMSKGGYFRSKSHLRDYIKEKKGSK